MTQVEAVILQHPGISRVIVVGLPDNRFTEMVVACIQLQENWQWTDADSLKLINKKDHCLCAEILQQFCKDKNLTRYLFMYLSHFSFFLSLVHLFGRKCLLALASFTFSHKQNAPTWPAP